MKAVFEVRTGERNPAHVFILLCARTACEAKGAVCQKDIWCGVGTDNRGGSHLGAEHEMVRIPTLCGLKRRVEHDEHEAVLCLRYVLGIICPLCPI